MNIYYSVCAKLFQVSRNSHFIVSPGSDISSTKKQNNFWDRLTLLKKHLILLRSLEEAFSKNSVKFSDCRAFNLLCSEHLDADCFEYTMRLQNELLGSCPWKQKLKPEAIPTNFPRKPARSARTSSSRRTDKRQRQEVCKNAGCGYTNAMVGNS